MNEHLTFLIDYPTEMGSGSKTTRRLLNVYCLVEVEKPLVDLIVDGKANAKDLKLYSGVVQRIQLRLKYGTSITVARTSKLVLRQVSVGSKQKLEFLVNLLIFPIPPCQSVLVKSPTGSWSNEVEMTVPDHCAVGNGFRASDGDHLVDVFILLPIEGMNFSADQQALISQREVSGHSYPPTPTHSRIVLDRGGVARTQVAFPSPVRADNEPQVVYLHPRRQGAVRTTGQPWQRPLPWGHPAPRC